MDFRPDSDRAIPDAGFDEEGTTPLPQRHENEHDFDAPAWGGPRGWTPSTASRRFAPRLIDLERRARFARLPLDQN